MQACALECGEDGSNLVYCAPTSGEEHIRRTGATPAICWAMMNPSHTLSGPAIIDLELHLELHIALNPDHKGGKSMVAEVLMIRQLLRHLSGHRLQRVFGRVVRPPPVR